MKLVKINKDNYGKFVAMIHWRMHGSKGLEGPVQVPDAIHEDHLHVYGLELDHGFVAWISMVYMPKIGRPDHPGYIYVDELWVEPSHRRMGYGQALMAKAEELCRAYKVRGIRFGVNIKNPGGQALYEKCGYKANGQAYMMEKELL